MSVLFACNVALSFGGCRGTVIVADEQTSDSATQTSEPIPTDTGSSIDSDTDSASTSDSDTGAPCVLPPAFFWTSSDLLVSAPGGFKSIKDPTIIHDSDRWHMYATLMSDTGLNMGYLSFTDPADAGSAEVVPVNTNTNLTGYKAAPQLFYFTPQARWYLIYQTPEPSYSTSVTPGDVASWSAATQFMPTPQEIVDAGKSGIDYWVICDDTDCYLFFSALNDVLYRAKTTRELFPDGFDGTTEVVMTGSSFNLWDGCSVYKLAEENRYLLLVSAYGTEGRYYRAWTSDRLDGVWAPHADTEANPFAALNNVTGADWATGGISQGEILRENPDETMTIRPCEMQFMFSGPTRDTADTDSEYFGLGLLQLVSP